MRPRPRLAAFFSPTIDWTEQQKMLTPKDRPWYGSSEKGEYRLQPGDDEHSLWEWHVNFS
jgi:hypothetical protein